MPYGTSEQDRSERVSGRRAAARARSGARIGGNQGCGPGGPGPVWVVCARLGARAARVRRPDRAPRATDCGIPTTGPVVAGFGAGRGSGPCHSRSAVSRCETDSPLGPAARIWPAPPGRSGSQVRRTPGRRATCQCTSRSWGSGRLGRP